MKTITLKEAFALLEDCAGILTDEGIMFPSLADLEEKNENEFLYLSWTDDEGTECYTRFREGENREVKVSGGSFFLIDSEGEECHITPLWPRSL